MEGFVSKSPTINSTYNFPPEYLPWVKYQEIMLTLDENTREYDLKRTMINFEEPVKTLMEEWVKYDYPFFLMSRDFIQILDNTDVFGGLNVVESGGFPFPTFDILLPEGSLILNDGSDVAILRVGDWVAQDTGMFTAYIMTANHNQIGDGIIGGEIFILAVDENGNFNLEINDNINKQGKNDVWGKDNERLNALVINLLTALAVDPKLKENDYIKSKLRLNRNSPPKIYREPKWLGARIKIERPLGADGKPVRCHWRRGHFRQQNFGKGNSESKIIFIRPVLVNKD